jgi:hypothetical protein
MTHISHGYYNARLCMLSLQLKNPRLGFSVPCDALQARPSRIESSRRHRLSTSSRDARRVGPAIAPSKQISTQSRPPLWLNPPPFQHIPKHTQHERRRELLSGVPPATAVHARAYQSRAQGTRSRRSFSASTLQLRDGPHRQAHRHRRRHRYLRPWTSGPLR